MELRQLRYFVRVVEIGSMGRAAADLGVVTSALSQQISRLEGELSTRLLQRAATGVRPTDAGLAFLHQARLALRHADGAASAARESRLAGQVSLGLPSSIAAVLAQPLLLALRDRHPGVRLHLVESLSGSLAALLNSRALDLAVVFGTESARRWSVTPLLDEALFVIGRPDLPGMPAGQRTTVAALAGLPLVLPTGLHGLRAVVNAAFEHARLTPQVVLEIDGLVTLLDSVRAGLGATIQPGAVAARVGAELSAVRLAGPRLHRRCVLASLSDDELSPAALALRTTLHEVAVDLVRRRQWPGATLHER